jgi:Ser/Thr protein kinase RdoA (MazF antagonist)
MELPIHQVLLHFGIDSPDLLVDRVGAGHINKTFKITTSDGSYILQQINTKVFVKPGVIESNLAYTGEYLSKNYPDYLFISPIFTKNGRGLAYVDDEPWRIYPYMENTFTVDDVQSVDQAYEAARAFGRFGRFMKGCDLSRFGPTIERFHDLALRYDQFQSALANANEQTKSIAADEIRQAIGFQKFAEQYKSVIGSGALVPGIFHNDTKINNVLFDRGTNKAIAVIDLDTVMEGYFIYDLGDLVRTLVSPVSEEEKDPDKIIVRPEFYNALVDGYLSEMGDAISKEERSLASFAGIMMTYIMALRFLADFLRGNTYYHISYPDQNLVRAKNQLRLTELLSRK